MMKRGIFVILFLSFLNFGRAQSRDALSVTAGVSLPNAPAQFYDYWSQGWGGSIQYSSRVEYFYGWSVSAEYNSFAFDPKRFLDHFFVIDPHAEIKGAASGIYSAYGAVEFYMPEFESFSVSPFVGFGGLLTTVSEANVTYTFKNTTVPSDTKFMFQFPYGIKIISLFSGDYNIFLEAKKNIGLNRLKDKNTDLVSIRAGLRMNLN
ncbi:MAG: hypothetical protein KA247_01590 [Bacteroidetes bacterium]|nr:hypothetical protein [Bacteroidota bacterium]